LSGVEQNAGAWRAKFGAISKIVMGCGLATNLELDPGIKGSFRL
jgi:hypothetical protein